MRQDVFVNIKDDGHEVRFKIRQMSAVKTESWLIRLAILLAKSGRNIDLSSGSGFSAILSVIHENPLSLIGGIDYGSLKPLIDELMETCVKIDGRVETVCTDDILDGCITSVSNLMKLRWEVIKANFDFFSDEKKSDSQHSQSKQGIVIER